MTDRLPSLNALRVFEVAGRHQHFTRAAEELSLSQGAVSYQIRILETELGFPLFSRTGRSVCLSREGLVLWQVLHTSFGDVGDVVERLRRQWRTPVQEVAIGITTYFASRWLLKRLSRFMAMYPDIGVRIAYPPATGRSISDTVIEVRWGDGQWPDIAAIKLFDAGLTPVCAPSLLGDGVDRIATDDLHNYRFLHDDDNQEAWRRWQAAAGIRVPLHLAGPVIADPNLRMQAAVDGQGITLADRLTAEELSANLLVTPIDVTLHGYGYYLLFRSAPDAPHMMFADWVQAEAAL